MTGNISDVNMEMDGACKMDRQNKKCTCARKSRRRKNNARTDKEDNNKINKSVALQLRRAKTD